MRFRRTWPFALVAFAALAGLFGWYEHVRRAAITPVQQVALPGRPFQALPARDGAWIFASLTETDAGGHAVAVLRRSGGRVSFVRQVTLDAAPTGMVLTHDGKLLVVAAEQQLAFFDVARLISGAPKALLGYLDAPRAGTRLGRVYVNVSPDDRYVFSSDERARTITVVDLAKARASGFAARSIVGTIPVGIAPIALTFSPDGKLLYTTSEAMPPRSGWPLRCRREGSSPSAPPSHSEGAILVVDVRRAETDPRNAVLGAVPAGCNPVRLVLSPNGDVAYVTARGSNALLAFDTRKLLADPSHALIARVPVGRAPVGVTVFDSGRRLLVTSSNRFAGNARDRQPVFVVDATRLGAGSAAVLGTIPAGAFPRELRVTPDGRTLLLTNYRSKTLEIVDLTRLPLVPRAP